VTIIRERHAFEGQSLAVISSIRRRGVLLVLVVLPDGSRSLIPANWTDWSIEQAKRTPADDAGDGSHDLGRLGDLLHLRKIIDALYARHVESVPCKESSHAIESGLSRPARSSTGPLSSSLIGNGVVRWRACDLIMRLYEEFALSVSDDTIYRALKDLGYSHVSARPRAYKQDPDAIAAFKNTLPHAWKKSARHSRPAHL
jgi:hypothetical protein